jgi:cell wall-associated NlpC family hydrolase
VDSVTIQAQIPINPTPQPKQDNSLGELVHGALGSSSTDGLSKGTKNAHDFVAFALKQVGDSYVYGAKVDVGSENPSAFDCSGLTQWAAAQVGVSIPRTSGAQLAGVSPLTVDQAAQVRGALLGKKGEGANGHVVISLGDGNTTVEAMGSKYGVRQGNIKGRGFDAAGLIKGMNYGSKKIDTNQSTVFDGGSVDTNQSTVFDSW